MADNTKIEWADASVNTLYGCTKASPGCQNCYAVAQTRRLVNLGHTELCGLTTPPTTPATDWSGEVLVHPKAAERMDQVLRWRKPRVVFVNSMSDTFHDQVPWDHQRDWFVTAALAPHHRFLFLTKRPENMADFLTDDVTRHMIECEWERRMEGVGFLKMPWPLPNVWLGCTAEDQQRLDERWPHMGRLSLAGWNTFLSCEPLLGPLDLWGARHRVDGTGLQGAVTSWPGGVRWVIVGGESGPNARPMHPDWVRQIVADCQGAGVPVMFKQWGEWLALGQDPEGFDVTDNGTTVDGLPVYRVGKRNAGRLIDGAEVMEWPKGVRG